MSGNTNAASEATRFEEGRPNSHIVTDSSTLQHLSLSRMTSSNTGVSEDQRTIANRLAAAEVCLPQDRGSFPS